MSCVNVKRGLESVAFTTPVPFSKDGSDIRYDAYRENLATIEQAGGSLYIPCGNTGEYHSLTNRERISVVEATVKAVADDAVVVAGAAGSIGEVTTLSESYESVGADGLMIMHPDHTYVHDEGLKQYYRRIASATDLPVLIYKQSHEVPDTIVADVAEHESVVGVKYAVNDISGFSKLAEIAPEEFVRINGLAERFAPAYALEGAVGFTTGIGNFVPNVSLSLQEALETEDWERARRIRTALRPYEELREESGDGNSQPAANNVPAVKYGMELSGLTGGPVRYPLVELSPPDRTRAEKYYDRIISEVGK